MKVQSRDWRALRRTATIVVDGEEVTLRKRGVALLLDDVARIPVLGDAIELVIGKSIGKGTTTEAFREAISQAAKDAGIDAGKALREVVTNLPRVIVDILVDDTILASEEERPAYREWVETLGPSGLSDAIVGWVGLNLPEFKDPFLRGVATLLHQGNSILTTLQAAANAPAAVDEAELQAAA